MKIKFTDINKQVLSNEQIYFEYGGRKTEIFTDTEGFIELTEVKAGTKVTCYKNSKEKHKFVVEDDKELEILIKSIETNMTFVAENRDGKLMEGVKVMFEYSDKKIEKESNNLGQIILEKIPVNTEVKVFQLVDEKELNLSIHKCTKETLHYSIILDEPAMRVNMRIKLVEKSGQTIKNADVRIKQGNKETDTQSGQDGYIVVKDVEVGTILECKQIIQGRMLPWHKLTCDAEIDEYILHGERPLIYTNYSDKIDSQVRMKFRLINSKNIPIPNAVLKIEYGEKVRNKYSNQQGEAIIDDVLIGDKVKVYVDIRGKSTESEFICQEDNEQYNIVLRTNHIPVYFWIIPLAVILFVLIYLAGSGGDDSSSTDKEDAKKKDTVIINNYSFYAKNSKTGTFIQGVKIDLIYVDTTVTKITDQKGNAVFASFAHHLPLKFELNKYGYQTYKKDFVLDSIFSIGMVQDDSMEIDPVVALCGTEIKSKGFKTTIKSVKMNMPKGRFNIWYNLFAVPTKVDVYKGKAKDISPQNLIFSNNGYMKGISNPRIDFESPDSLITICMEAKSGATSWVYKVYCAKIPVARPVVPVVNQPTKPVN
jgi:hypothetical protein